MEKYEQFQLVLAEVSKIKNMDSYHTIFLSTMVLRKLRHPEEGLREITNKTMRKMETRYSPERESNREEEILRRFSIGAVNTSMENYGKKHLITISTQKCLQALEEALEKAELPKEMESALTGENVKSVFDYLTKKLRADMEKLAEE